MTQILLVEDDPDIRQIAEMSLSMLGGYVVHTSDSGPAALIWLETERPDLILMDMMMPGMTGLEVLDCLKRNERLQDIPVVFLTAKAQPTEVAYYISQGARGVIVKPFDPITLPGQVDGYLQ